MAYKPRSVQEAEQLRYGQCSWNPQGDAYNKFKCAAHVFNKNGWGSHQCTRTPVQGEIFCKQHLKERG